MITHPTVSPAIAKRDHALPDTPSTLEKSTPSQIRSPRRSSQAVGRLPSMPSAGARARVGAAGVTKKGVMVSSMRKKGSTGAQTAAAKETTQRLRKSGDDGERPASAPPASTLFTFEAKLPSRDDVIAFHASTTRPTILGDKSNLSRAAQNVRFSLEHASASNDPQVAARIPSALTRSTILQPSGSTAKVKPFRDPVPSTSTQFSHPFVELDDSSRPPRTARASRVPVRASTILDEADPYTSTQFSNITPPILSPPKGAAGTAVPAPDEGESIHGGSDMDSSIILETHEFSLAEGNSAMSSRVDEAFATGSDECGGREKVLMADMVPSAHDDGELGSFSAERVDDSRLDVAFSKMDVASRRPHSPDVERVDSPLSPRPRVPNPPRIAILVTSPRSADASHDTSSPPLERPSQSPDFYPEPEHPVASTSYVFPPRPPKSKVDPEASDGPDEDEDDLAYAIRTQIALCDISSSPHRSSDDELILKESDQQIGQGMQAGMRVSAAARRRPSSRGRHNQILDAALVCDPDDEDELMLG